MALIRLFSILPLLSEQGIDVALAGRQVISTLDSFETIWSVGLIIFGLHLLGLGYLSILNRQVPILFGYLLILAGLGYMAIHISVNFTGLNEGVLSMMEKILMAPMALGEILLAFWLIIRGGKTRKS